MNQIRSGPRRSLTIVGLVAILAGACNASASPSPSAAPSTAASQVAAATPSPTPLVSQAPIDTSEPGPNGGVVVRWFVGLGAGSPSRSPPRPSS